jgi:glycerol-3-phosphate dehydrogenase
MRYDVAVIGGGVIGCAIARELSRYRLRAVVIERECEVGLGTSKANSGIIHAGHHGAEGTLKGELEWRGNQMWDALADDLHFGFKRVGDLTCAFDEDQRATLRQIMEQGKRRGVPGLELWGPERIRREEPHLSHDIVEALYAPTAGVVNPYEACFMLAESAVRNGVDLALERTVLGIRRSEKGFDIDTTVGGEATPEQIKAHASSSTPPACTPTRSPTWSTRAASRSAPARARSTCSTSASSATSSASSSRARRRPRRAS